MKSIILIVILIFVNSIVAHGQQQEKIDRFINETLSEFEEIPSLGITVIKDGKPYFTKTYGFSDIKKKREATTKTPYYIASVTKSFVGLLAAQLEREGLFNLDDPITKFKPIKDFQNSSMFKDVTIRNLLDHTSGIGNNTLTWQFSAIGQYDYALLTKLLKLKTSSRNNGKSYRYDNFGYNVLDIILHEEFGLSWKDLLQQKIFAPLDMNRTTAYPSKAIREKWEPAQPYAAISIDRLPHLVSSIKNDKTFQAAGGMICSIDDLQKWLLLYVNNGTVGGKRIFNEDLISKTLNPSATNKSRGTIFDATGYGLGWNSGIFKDKRAYYHFGGFDGHFAHVSFLAEENIGIAVISNENHFGDNVSNLIASFIYDLLLGNVKEAADYKEEIDKVKARVDNIQQGGQKDKEYRSSRKWTLKHKTSAYVGTYQNEFLGDLIISLEGNRLTAKLGISKAIAEPSRSDDSIRVEFRDSRGTEILFISDKEGVLALVYNGFVFLK